MKIEIEILLEGRRIEKKVFSKEEISIGRSSTSDIILSEKRVSRLHALLKYSNNTWQIINKSANGTFIDSHTIENSKAINLPISIDIYPYMLQISEVIEDELTIPISTYELQNFNREIEPIKTETPLDSASQNSDPTLHFDLIIGDHPKMLDLYKTIERTSKSSASVLIRGEHGTGKELIAKAIHTQSKRSNAPFIAINCAAIPEALFESELFGFEKGSFTGANKSSNGKVMDANNGTLFLDEIGELSLSAQAKLLRFIQDKKISRIGTSKELTADVRIVTATNKNLEEEVEQNSFRADLYYRLRVVQLSLPSLRKRRSDIEKLVHFFCKNFYKQNKIDFQPVLTQKTIENLEIREWPGNIRQLENLLYGSLVNAESPPKLLVSDLEPDHIFSEKPTDNNRQTEEPPDHSFAEASKQTLLKTLKECGGDTAKAAKILNVSRGTIYYKLKKFNINPKHSK